jgi:excisionase family DNA binding protein
MNPLHAYFDTSPPDADEFARLREEINEAIMSTLSDRDVERLKRHLSYSRRWGLKVVRAEDIGDILARKHTAIWSYEKGEQEIPIDTMVLLRALHDRVTSNPRLARQRLMAWLIEQEKTEDDRLVRDLAHRDFYRVDEFAEIVNESVRTIRNRIRSGAIDAERDEDEAGRPYRIPSEQLDVYLSHTTA